MAFVIDVFAHRVVGSRVSDSMRTDFVLDPLEQTLYARRHERDGSLNHHRDRGTLQWVSRSNTQRLLGSIGYTPPAEAEANYYRLVAETKVAEFV